MDKLEKSIPILQNNIGNKKYNSSQDDGVRYIGTRHPDWPVDEKKIFPEKQINKYAGQVVDKNYERNKNNYPLTQSTEIAKDLLSFKVKDGHIENNDGRRITNAKEAIELNAALDKNFNDHKTDSYLKKLERFGIENSSTKHPDYPKATEGQVQQLQSRLNNARAFVSPPNNPTVNRYKQFRENKKRELEEKKFNEDFEKEYGEQATKNYVRAKVNKNKREGKKDYENLSINDIIVNEHTKDEAKKKLKIFKNVVGPSSSSLDNLHLLNNTVKDIKPTKTFEDHYRDVVDRENNTMGLRSFDPILKNYDN